MSTSLLDQQEAPLMLRSREIRLVFQATDSPNQTSTVIHNHGVQRTTVAAAGPTRPNIADTSAQLHKPIIV